MELFPWSMQLPGSGGVGLGRCFWGVPVGSRAGQAIPEKLRSMGGVGVAPEGLQQWVEGFRCH